MKQSTKKDKYDHPFKVNGKYTDEFIIRLCEDFHFTSMDNDQLAAKFFMPVASVRQYASRYSPEELLAMKKAKKKQYVIMIDEQYYQAATETLMIYKIPFDKLNDATVSLEYKSKL